MVLNLQIVFVMLALIFFSLGAVGVTARINWDQAGKAALVAGWLAGYL